MNQVQSLGKNRIELRFQSLNEKGQKAFIPYLAAGVPSDEATVNLVLELEKNGADIVELGYPFSDPMADGVVNQAAANRALQLGVNAERYFEMAKQIRKKSELPLIVFSYLNPIHHLGIRKFCQKAKEAGMDGILLVDMPVEEADELCVVCSELDLCPIFLVAPTTTMDRLHKVLSVSRGFVYYISRTGITGEQNSFQNEFEIKVRSLKEISSLPVVVGFGINTPEQVRTVCGLCDGVVVGSAIVRRTLEAKTDTQAVQDAISYVKPMVSPTKEIWNKGVTNGLK